MRELTFVCLKMSIWVVYALCVYFWVVIGVSVLGSIRRSKAIWDVYVAVKSVASESCCYLKLFMLLVLLPVVSIAWLLEKIFLGIELQTYIADSSFQFQLLLKSLLSVMMHHYVRTDGWYTHCWMHPLWAIHCGLSSTPWLRGYSLLYQRQRAYITLKMRNRFQLLLEDII